MNATKTVSRRAALLMTVGALLLGTLGGAAGGFRIAVSAMDETAMLNESNDSWILNERIIRLRDGQGDALADDLCNLLGIKVGELEYFVAEYEHGPSRKTLRLIAGCQAELACEFSAETVAVLKGYER